MTGIWDTFEIPEVMMVADFFTCGSGGENTERTAASEVDNRTKMENRPKRRSLYLPSNEEGSVKSKATINIEENLILNRYAPKSRSIIEKSIPEEQQDESNTSMCRNDTETPLVTSDSSRAEVTTCENDRNVDSYIHDRKREVEPNVIRPTQIQRAPNYGNVIVVVRRDVKNNTIAINFEEKPT